MRASIHGLVVETALPAHGLRPAAPEAAPDVTIARRSSAPAAGGAHLASLGGDDGYVVERAGDDVVARFPALGAAAVVDPGRGTIGLAGDVEDEIAGLLAHGHALALLLALRGELVLHASAVAIGGRTIAFAGGPGAGKTTLAAALCAEGAEVVADDALRVAPRAREGPAPAAPLDARCWPGAVELRLRGTAPGDLPSRTTADGRIALTPPPAPDGPRPLDALLIPTLGDATALDRRHRAEAAMDLMALSRVTNWTAPSILAAQFDVAAAVADVLPVHLATVPAHPAERPDVASQLVERLALLP